MEHNRESVPVPQKNPTTLRVFKDSANYFRNVASKTDQPQAPCLEKWHLGLHKSVLSRSQLPVNTHYLNP